MGQMTYDELLALANRQAKRITYVEIENRELKKRLHRGGHDAMSCDLLPTDTPGRTLPAQAEVLRQQRVAEHVGLRELAKMMDLPPSYLSKIEQGHVEITPALIEQYKKALLTIELTGRSAV